MNQLQRVNAQKHTDCVGNSLGSLYERWRRRRWQQQIQLLKLASETNRKWKGNKKEVTNRGEREIEEAAAAAVY